MTIETSQLYALGSCLAFSVSSVAFAHYSRKISALWMNCFKACVALTAFGLCFAFTHDFHSWPNLLSLSAFFLSGLIGLNIADIFLLKSFSAIGPSRTLMIFAFQPIILGVFAYFAFHQELSVDKIIAILFLISCVFTVSYEGYRKTKRWDLRGPVFALIGVLLDSVGIVITRFGFDSDLSVKVLEGNFYRCLGACVGFIVISRFIRMPLISTFRSMNRRDRSLLIASSLGGTFVSLWFYLSAISMGHLASVAAIAGSSPVFAAITESGLSQKWPSRYLFLSFFLFAIGFYLLL